MTALAIVIVGSALLVLALVAWRLRPYLPTIGAAMLTRPGLAAAALILSLGAGVIFSAMLASIIAYLQGEKRSDDLAYLAFGLLGVLALTTWSIHRLLGSKMAIDLEVWKFRANFHQGDEGPAAAQAVAEVAKDKADQITEDAKP